MNSPKVKFKIADINFETEIIHNFIFGRWSETLYRYHPELKIVSKVKDKKKRMKIIENYVKNFWEKNRGKLENRKLMYEGDWNNINDNYMLSLSEVLETKWPDKKSMTALISICPINPRFLKTWTFSVCGLKMKRKNHIRIISHEILHFLYFKKWKEIFPNSNERTFENPHLIWRLSEILAPVILNDPRIRKVIHTKPNQYMVHMKTKIGNRSITKHFALIYKKNMTRKESFSNFLKESYEEIQRYRKLMSRLS